MRKLLFICTLLAFKTSFSQDVDKLYTFREIGWTIILPSDFKVLSSAEDAAKVERGARAMEEANNIKADLSQLRTLVSATKNTHNYFNATLTPYDPKVDGDYKTSNKVLKGIIYKTFFEKMPDARIDSATTSETIDGLTFDKFHVTVSINQTTIFNMFLLSRLYKGYDFGISYLYLDEKTREQIEAMIRNSKFSK